MARLGRGSQRLLFLLELSYHQLMILLLKSNQLGIFVRRPILSIWHLICGPVHLIMLSLALRALGFGIHRGRRESLQEVRVAVHQQDIVDV